MALLGFTFAYGAHDLMRGVFQLVCYIVVAFSFTTYAENGRFVVCADNSVFSSNEHAQELVQGFLDELDFLKNNKKSGSHTV
jgi:hypothetical protein